MARIKDNTPQHCPKCGGTFYFTTVCPYCHTDIVSNKTVDPQNAAMKKFWGIIVCILLGVWLIFGISQCEGNDNSCERCNKQGVYEIDGDRYCEKHYKDIMGELIAWDGN